MEEMLKKIVSNEEMRQLFVKLREGDYSVRNQLIEVNLRLVPYIVYSEFKYINYDKDDLISIGMIGLINAVDTYDLSKDKRFSSYATRCVSNIIISFLRKENCNIGLVSLDSDIQYDQTLMDIVRSDEDIEEDVIDKDLRKYEENMVRSLINRLNSRDREIIKLYFGFYDNRCYKQMEIANIIGIPQSYVSSRIKYVKEFMLHQFSKTDSSIYSYSCVKKKKRDR